MNKVCPLSPSPPDFLRKSVLFSFSSLLPEEMYVLVFLKIEMLLVFRILPFTLVLFSPVEFCRS